jgi:pyruvoyl-dependent arginine decarboxylase (PvlArgDC)
VLPQKKYASIITILHNMKDLSTMTPGIVIGKIVAFEMSRKMGQEEASSSSKGKALACSEKKKMNGKLVETSSSSSSSSEDEEEDEDDDDESSEDDQSSSSTSDLDEESIKLIKKVEKMIQRLNVKGVPIQIHDLIFTNQRNEQRKRGCYGCGELGHFVEVFPNKPTPKTKKKECKNQALTSIKSWDDSSSEEEHHHKRRGRKHSSSSSSRMCLMARGNKSSSSSESDSDDEMPSYEEIVQQNLNYAKVYTSQQKKLEKLKEKLDSS